MKTTRQSEGTSLIAYRAPGAIAPERAISLVDSFLSGRTPRTIAAYRADLQDFARSVGAEDLDAAARLFPLPSPAKTDTPRADDSDPAP